MGNVHNVTSVTLLRNYNINPWTSRYIWTGRNDANQVLNAFSGWVGSHRITANETAFAFRMNESSQGQYLIWFTKYIFIPETRDRLCVLQQNSGRQSEYDWPIKFEKSAIAWYKASISLPLSSANSTQLISKYQEEWKWSMSSAFLNVLAIVLVCWYRLISRRFIYGFLEISYQIIQIDTKTWLASTSLKACIQSWCI